ncbi:hypothetical protein Tamer19_70270 [Cupriavidus sp. TA19]|uniref:hypothetical protein n=1 Tax=unclassified Cupriavidus TaxID=2640874 RepID=UPI0011C1688B|nr:MULTISPECIES: hypothetical protein [unclassified Cupriavidus]BDB24834.1 hypothetical protein CTP10_R21990 [Cupriavidus sp. P-10]GLC97618.1 hypothetical protein Tamer19_70270 [Cupriavidus sp. TA19]
MPSPFAWLSIFSLLTLMLVPELLDAMPGRSVLYAKAKGLARFELVVPCLPGPFASVALITGRCPVNAAEVNASVPGEVQRPELPVPSACASVPGFKPPCAL